MKLFGSLLLVLVLVPSWSTEPRVPLWRGGAGLHAMPIRLNPDNAAQRSVGRLTFLRGWRLSSDDPAFGGISSMLVEGDRFTLLSDYSLVTRFRLSAAGTPSEVRFGELPRSFGTGWARPDRDSESMLRDPAGKHVWMGFEGWNAILRLSPDLARRERGVRPQLMLDWDSNGGPESMAWLGKDGFVVISETSDWPHAKGRAAIRYRGDPTDPHPAGFRFAYLPPAGFNPSDAVTLPDGRLLVLNRRFALPYRFSAVLTIVDPAAIRPNRMVRGREIARFEAPLLHDNFEALAAVREGKDTIVWMASDDNQSILQQTLLLKFRLDDASR